MWWSLDRGLMMNLGRALLLFFFFLTLEGCGYRLRHRLRDSLMEPRGIYVSVFDNQSMETGAERIFTNALIHELESHQELVFLDPEEGAYEMQGTISSISYGVTATTDPPFGGLQDYKRLPTEFGVSVGVGLQLIHPRSKRVIWGGGFSGYRRVNGAVDRSYDIQSPSSLGFRSQSIIQSVYPAIARDIMRDAYDQMVELFE